MAQAQTEAVIAEFKKMFIQRRVRKLDAAAVAEAVKDFARLDAEVAELKSRWSGESLAIEDEELATAQLWRAMGEDREALSALERWAAALPLAAPERIAHWVSYRQPHALDYSHLVQIERPRAEVPELMIGPEEKLRRRDGFKLTDARMNEREVLDEAHYCLYCHDRDKDSCSKGFVEKDSS